MKPGLLFVILAACLNAVALDPVTTSLDYGHALFDAPFRSRALGDYTPFQIMLYPKYPWQLFRTYTVTGVALGGQMQSSIYGVQAGVLINVPVNCGVSAGIYQYCRYNYGLLCGLVNISGKENHGVQLGVYNSAEHGLQFGLLNYNQNAWFPFMILFNYSAGPE